ncbi:MAG: cobalamin-dependent protein [bacterium]
MKIILTRPHMREVSLIAPPLGLGYLSSCLRQAGHEVELIDGHALSLSYSELVRKCVGADVVGVNCLTISKNESIELTRALKKEHHTVVLGGPHASGAYKELIEASGADYVVVGEGEESFPILVRNLEEKKEPRGLLGIFRSGERRVVRRPLIQDLDLIPYPDWEQMASNLYGMYASYRKKSGAPSSSAAPFLVSRGCCCVPENCPGNPVWGKTLRYRSPENIVGEMELLVRTHGYTEVHLEDENPVKDKEWFERICRLIIEREVSVEWGLTTANPVFTKLDMESLHLMRESGCYFLMFDLGKYAENPASKEFSFVGEQVALEMTGLSKKNGMITGGSISLELVPLTEEGVEKTSIALEKIFAPLALDIFCLNVLVFGERSEAETMFQKFQEKIRKRLESITPCIIVQMLTPGTSFLGGDAPPYQDCFPGSCQGA